MKHVAVLLIFTILLVSNPAMAGSSDWSNVGKLKQGTYIVIERKNGEIVEGRFGAVVSDELSVISDSQRVAKVRKEDIREIKRKKKSTGMPILIGVAIGAGGGYAAGRISETEGDRQEDPGLVPLFGTAIGAGIGALVGVAVSRGSEKLIYRAEFL